MKKGGNRWIVMINGSKIVGPFGQTEAESEIRKIRRRYRAVGLTPPRLDATRVQPREYADSWVAEDITRRCMSATGDATADRGGSR